MNILLVAAAGNDGKYAELFPASYNKVLGVKAINESETLWPKSNYHNKRAYRVAVYDDFEFGRVIEKSHMNDEVENDIPTTSSFTETFVDTYSEQTIKYTTTSTETANSNHQYYTPPSYVNL